MSTKRIALITGANKGIGLETARELAQQGFTVLLGARSGNKGAAAAETLRGEGLEVTPVTIDVEDPGSIQRALEFVEADFGALDILINNAGVKLDIDGLKPSEQSIDIWRGTFETNLFGMIAVTQAFLPLLRKSEAGRIVNLSSVLASLTMQSDPESDAYEYKIPAYNASKTAVNAWTVHLAYELKDTPIKVNSAHPGWVKTDMGGEGAPMKPSEGAKTSIALATLPADGPTGTFAHMDRTLPW